tara:strand:- start:3552 stop:3875 length:324 start_codon:yes stop_codon:yes gene_type:complete
MSRGSEHSVGKVLLPVNNLDELEINDRIIEERELAISTLCEDVHDLNDMFKDLALMVEEQGEGVNLIADNISSSETNTSKVNKELEKAETHQRKNGTCCCRCVCVIM